MSRPDLGTRPRGPSRRAWPPTAHIAAATIAAAGLALLAAACGGSSGDQVANLGSTAAQSSSTSSSHASAASAQQNGALAFARCMRSNGVPNWPDPKSGVKLTPQQLGVSDSRLQAAQNACRHLLPNGGRPPDQARLQQIKAQGLKFSQCVRRHGVPDFPDPGSDGRIPDPASVGIDQGSPKFQAANQACRKYRPPYMPSNAAYDAWAKTHTGTGS